MLTSVLATYLAVLNPASVPHQSRPPITKININCGIPPIPPIGCRVGACMCDQSGRNCRWTFVCN